MSEPSNKTTGKLMLRLMHHHFWASYPENQYRLVWSFGGATVLRELDGDQYHFFVNDEFYFYPVIRTRDMAFGRSIMAIERYWRMAYPRSQFLTHWFFDNKVILHDRTDGLYIFFKKEGQWPNEQFITLFSVPTDQLKEGIERAKNLWNPPPPPPPAIDFKTMALDHIENMITSLVKRNNEAQLTKADFSFIYYGTDSNWHAFYPPVERLIGHHLSKTEQNEQYLNFLRSDKFQQTRNEWDRSPNIDMPNTGDT